MTSSPILSSRHLGHANPAMSPPDAGPDPSVHGTIDRRLVHKRSATEVLLTDVRTEGADLAHVGIRIARSHTSNAEHSRTVPLIAGLEVMRQLGLAIGHLNAGVPSDWAFVLQHAAFAWHDAPEEFPAYLPFEARARVTVHDVVERRGQVSRLSASAEVVRRGRTVAIGSGEFRCLPPATYLMLRRRAAAHARVEDRDTEPRIVTDARYTEGGVSGRLGWPSDDPFLFDHDVDHVPGMLLAAAGITAHRMLRPSHEPIGIEVACERFAEIADDVTVEAAAAGPSVTTRLRQAAESVGTVVTSDAG